jgi:hypothetical protein
MINFSRCQPPATNPNQSGLEMTKFQQKPGTPQSSGLTEAGHRTHKARCRYATCNPGLCRAPDYRLENAVCAAIFSA